MNMASNLGAPTGRFDCANIFSYFSAFVWFQVSTSVFLLLIYLFGTSVFTAMKSFHDCGSTFHHDTNNVHSSNHKYCQYFELQ